MLEIRRLPGADERVETGVVQFGDDWPGVWIRGDHALLGYLPALQIALAALDGDIDTFTQSSLQGLADLLRSCNVRLHPTRRES